MREFMDLGFNVEMRLKQCLIERLKIEEGSLMRGLRVFDAEYLRNEGFRSN